MMRAERGHTLVEVAVSAAILSAVAVISVGLIARGLDAQRQAIAAENANRTAGRLVEAIVRELKDAAGDTVVFSSATPDRITFQRMIGYDPTQANPADRRLLSQPITLRRTPMTVPGATGLYALERLESGRPTVKLGGYLASTDPDAPALPGLRFDVTSSLGNKVIDVVVTTSFTAGLASGPIRARRETTVTIEVD